MQSVYWVDQESFLRMMVEKTLKLAQISIYTADSSEVGAYIIKDLNPDLLVWDVETLKDSGVEILNEILRDSQIPVVLVGFPEARESIDGLELKNKDLPFLEKPLSSTTLIDELKAKRAIFGRG